MPVYVSTGRRYWQRMIAETTEDLHAFATILGLPLGQAKNDDPDVESDYYWVHPRQKDLAVDYGAVRVTPTQLTAMLELQRRGVEMGNPVTAYDRLVEHMRPR